MTDAGAGAPHPNLTSTLTARLTNEIVAGKLPPRTRLPTERSLMETYGVSRTVVREAIAALRAEGLVETRQGSGAYVAADARNRPFRIDPKGLKSLDQVVNVMELRLCVEVEAAGIAAERRSKQDVAGMKRINRAMGEAIKKGEPTVDLDFDLHTAIGAATGNPYFSSFLEFIGRIIIPRRSILIDDHEHGGDPYLARIHREHEAIIAGIAKGDAAAARRAMRRHIVEGRERYRRLGDKREKKT
ncbi:MAG: FadR family transcriptional regulator [Bauldia sp.]|nr:FadR family transcriptional regulator [Bauldia sp.]